MEDLLRKQVIKELVIAAAASFIIFQLSFFFYLFIVPVLYIGRRRGAAAASVLGAALLVAVAVQMVFKMRGLDALELKGFIIAYGLSYPFALLAGTLIVSFFSGRSLSKITGSTVLFAVVSIPVILVFSGNSQVVEFLKSQIAYVTGILLSGEGSLSSLGITPEEIERMVKIIAFRDFIAAYFFLLSGCWYLADLFTAKKDKVSRFDAEYFTIPEWSVWVLIVSLAGVLADHLFPLGWMGYLSWNTALIMLLLYGIKGAGLIKYLFRKYKLAKQKQRSIIMMMFILFLIPGLNFIVLLGIPGLGVSEIWVRYR